MATFTVILNSEGVLADWTPPAVFKWGLYIFRCDGDIVRVGVRVRFHPKRTL